MKKDFKEEIKVQEEFDFINLNQTQKSDINQLIKKYQKVEELNLEVINEWIDKIIIDKVEARNIKIIWNL